MLANKWRNSDLNLDQSSEHMLWHVFPPIFSRQAFANQIAIFGTNLAKELKIGFVLFWFFFGCVWGGGGGDNGLDLFKKKKKKVENLQQQWVQKVFKQ